jgi:anti-anti-sigma factor
MTPNTYYINDTLIVNLEGDFDADIVKKLRGELEIYSELETPIVFDLSKVKFIDSSGIGALVFLYKRLSAKQLDLIIVGVNEQPEELFKMLHLDKTLICLKTISEYVQRHQTYNEAIRAS